MSDEINLILTKLKLVSEMEESGAYVCDKEHSKILYDYITNLQETLKKKQQRIKELLEETYSANQVVDELLDIEEENKRLKELCDKYEEEHSTRFNDWVFDKRENERLKERCEYLERSNNRREDEIMSLRDECVDGETYKSRNEKAIDKLNSIKND